MDIVPFDGNLFPVRLPKPNYALLTIVAIAAAGLAFVYYCVPRPSSTPELTTVRYTPPSEIHGMSARPLLPRSPIEKANVTMEEEPEEEEKKPPANSYSAMGGALEDFSAEQIEPYLQRMNRSAESLVVAAQLTRNAVFLREAVSRFPENPRAQLALAMGGTPEERTAAIQAFRKLEPDNSFGDYLLALERFQADDRQGGIDAFLAAGSKSQFRDYGSELAQEVEQALLMSGFTPLQACAFAYFRGRKESQYTLLSLGVQICKLQTGLYQPGMPKEMTALSLAGLEMLRHARDSGPWNMFHECLARAITLNLVLLHPRDLVTPEKKTVAEIFAEANTLKEEVMSLAASASRLLDDLGEEEALRYYRNVQQVGELQALRALVGEKRNKSK